MPTLTLPEKLYPLLEPKRYKVLHGGRGSAKSWSVARALIHMATIKPIRVLCARETQKSIQESVHRLLKDQIGELGVDGLEPVRDQPDSQEGFGGFLAQRRRHLEAVIVGDGHRVTAPWTTRARSASKPRR